MIMSTCGVSSSGTSSMSGARGCSSSTRCALYDGIRSTRHCGRQSSSRHTTSRCRPLPGDQRRDRVEEAAHRVDGSAVRGGDRRRHTEVRAKPHAGAVEQERGSGVPCVSSCQVGFRASRPSSQSGVSCESCLLARRIRRISRTHDGQSIQLRRIRPAMAAATAPRPTPGLAGLVITPGYDLRYLLGSRAQTFERLTALVLPAAGDPIIVVPRLELASLKESAVTELGLAVRDWVDGDDPYRLVADALGGGPLATARSPTAMPALHLLPLADVLGVVPVLATDVLRRLRMIKDAAEIDALRKAGAAIDRVHARVPEFLVPGRTEADVAADIAEAIVAEGHSEVAFIIVGSGPHGADPHHECSDRELRAGDIVVVDIGGPYDPGYNSDSTRTYSIGEPDPEVARRYAVLQRAQQAAVDAVRPGRHRRTGRRRRARRAGRRRPGRGVRAPHRTRHRAVGARGALHRGGQRAAAAGGHGVLRRAGHLLPRPVGRPHRGHRDRHRRRRDVGEQPAARPRRGAGGDQARRASRRRGPTGRRTRAPARPAPRSPRASG